MLSRHRKVLIPANTNGTPPAESSLGSGVAIYPGKVPNPALVRGQVDLETAPTMVQRQANQDDHSVQLFNGWQNTSYGLVVPYSGVGYLQGLRSTDPGQTRQNGGPLAGYYHPVGGSPAQFTAIQPLPLSTGPSLTGPGQMPSNVTVVNPGSGA